MKEKFQAAKRDKPAFGSFASIKDYRTVKRYESWVGLDHPDKYSDKVVKPEFKYVESEFNFQSCKVFHKEGYIGVS